MIIKLWK